MISLEYTMNQQETADATLNFLSNRPFLNIMFIIMRYSCILLCFGFIITLYQGNTRPEDFVAVFMAISWLIFYKNINRRIIKAALKGRKFDTMQRTVKFDDKGIFCQGSMTMPIDIAWKKLKHVLKTQNGYIIPLTGFAYAGKFFWVPYRAFTNQADEQQFLEYINKFKLKIKTVNS